MLRGFKKTLDTPGGGAPIADHGLQRDDGVRRALVALVLHRVVVGVVEGALQR